MAEMKETPCEMLAKKCDKNSVSRDIAAIGTDKDLPENKFFPNQTLQKTLMAYAKAEKPYPEFFAWWLRWGTDSLIEYGVPANITWIGDVIERKIPVLVVHN